MPVCDYEVVPHGQPPFDDPTVRRGTWSEVPEGAGAVGTASTVEADAPDDPPVVVWDSSGLLLVELLDESTVAFLRRRWERREGLAK